MFKIMEYLPYRFSMLKLRYLNRETVYITNERMREIRYENHKEEPVYNQYRDSQ